MERRIEATTGVVLPVADAVRLLDHQLLEDLFAEIDEICPFHGRLVLDGSTLTLTGTYTFVAPTAGRYGDGLRLHRLVRRSLTRLLEQLAETLQAHGADGLEVVA